MYPAMTCVACGGPMGLNTIHQCPPKYGVGAPCHPVRHFYVAKDSVVAPGTYTTVAHNPESNQTKPVFHLPPEHLAEQVKKALHELLSKEAEAQPELVETELSCPTCQRFFCKVRVPKGTPIAAICEGCLHEGR